MQESVSDCWRAGVMLVFAVTALLLLATAPTARAAVRTPAIPAIDLGNVVSAPLEAGRVLHVIVGLAPQHQSALQALIVAQHTPGSPDFRKFLTPAEYRARFAPSEAQVQKVVSWLVNAGFEQVKPVSNQLFVGADGTPAVIQAAFRTTLRLFQRNGQSLFANVTPASVPTTLTQVVTSILGLQDVARAHAFTRLAPQARTAAPGVAPLAPPQFAIAYDASSLPQANKTSVAVFVAGDMRPVLQDLRFSESRYHMPHIPVTVVKAGASGEDYTATDNNVEWDLDTQSTLGMAGNLQQLILYNSGTLDNRSILQSINRWVNEDRAPWASASFGECESDARSSGLVTALDSVLQQAVVQGQTLFVATGDGDSDTTSRCSSGTLSGIGVGSQFITYPASSPYAVAVGGTTLATSSDGSYLGETAWSGSIGGVSSTESAPSWQQGVVPPTGLLSSNVTRRAVPDLAMDGDPASGLILFVKGKTEQAGGTSLASPLAMAAVARAEQAAGVSTGFPLPMLYGLYGGTSGTPGFHDITNGGNGTYTAKPGWDYMTGLGTIDATALMHAMASDAGGSATPQPPPSSPKGSHPQAASKGGGSLPAMLLLPGLLVALLRRRKFQRG